MLIKDLTESQREKICEHYRKKYPRTDLFFYDSKKEGPCANCPLGLCISESEYTCFAWQLDSELSEEDTAIALSQGE